MANIVSRLFVLATALLLLHQIQQLDAKLRHGKSRRQRYRPEEDGIQIGARSDHDPVYRIPISDEKRLTKFILRNYARNGKGGRPIINSSLPMPVKFGLAMIQMGLDERDNTLTTSVWCRYKWDDQYLRWDPSDFGGVSTIRLSSRKIWIPDIMLYNTADTHKLERDVLVVVSHNGSVLWIPHRIYHSSCSVDVSNFPFDQQRCYMTFGSWAYHGNEIDLLFYEELGRMDISDLEKDNTEWAIIEQDEERRVQVYDCCTEPYVTLTFTLGLKRKLVFSSFILTLPCIFLACMTLVVFWLPPERPDRTSLAMSLFASFLLLLLILVETAPPTASSVPTLGVYYCFNMVIIMLSIFLSCVVINISRRGDALQPLPQWLRKITINGLARVFCARMIPPNRTLERKYQVSKCLEEAMGAVIINEEVAQSETADVEETRQSNGVSPEVNITTIKDGVGGTPHTKTVLKLLNNHFHLLERSLKSIEKTILDVSGELKEKDVVREKRELRMEWQIVAMTLDRIFFVIFVIAIVVSLAWLFPRPHSLSFYNSV